MSRHLSDLLRELADHETSAAAGDAPDPRTEVQMLTREITARRTGRLTVVAAGAAAAVVVGVLVAQAATTAPEPVPASPEPTSTSGPTATPTATVVTPDATPVEPVQPEAPDASAYTLGLLGTTVQTPQERWSVPVADLVPGWAQTDDPPLLGDVTRGSLLPGPRTVDAGTVEVALVTGWIGLEQHLVGVDHETGDVLWDRPTSSVDGRRIWSCVGVSPDDLVVCHGTQDGAGTTEVELLEPRTGAVVRSLPLSIAANTIGVAGDVVLAHGRLGDTDTLRWEAVDLATGASVWSHEQAGLVDTSEYPGDVLVGTVQVEGGLARLAAPGYSVTVELGTGELTTTTPLGVDDPTGTAPWGHDVWAPAPGVTGEGVHVDGAVVSGVVGDGVLLLGPDQLVLVDAEGGAERWSVPAGTVLGFDGERVLVAREPGGVDAVAVADGSTTWSVGSGSGCVMQASAGRLVCAAQSSLSLLR